MKATKQSLHRVLPVREELQRLLRHHFFRKNHLLVLNLLKLILDYQKNQSPKSSALTIRIKMIFNSTFKLHFKKYKKAMSSRLS